MCILLSSSFWNTWGMNSYGFNTFNRIKRIHEVWRICKFSKKCLLVGILINTLGWRICGSQGGWNFKNFKDHLWLFMWLRFKILAKNMTFSNAEGISYHIRSMNSQYHKFPYGILWKKQPHREPLVGLNWIPRNTCKIGFDERLLKTWSVNWKIYKVWDVNENLILYE